MADDEKTTPLVTPHEADQPEKTPGPVDTDAPVSTDECGEVVDLPDKGGKID